MEWRTRIRQIDVELSREQKNNLGVFPQIIAGIVSDNVVAESAS